MDHMTPKSTLAYLAMQKLAAAKQGALVRAIHGVEVRRAHPSAEDVKEFSRVGVPTECTPTRQPLMPAGLFRS